MGPAVPEAPLGMLPVGVLGHWSRYTFGMQLPASS
jgi:hypothetical protein